MNIAFPAILLAVVLMPGFVFTHTYRLDKGDRSVFTTYSKITVFAFVANGLLHALAVAMVSLLGFEINFHAFFDFLGGKAISKETVDAFANNMWFCFSYFMIVYSAAYLLGVQARLLVLKYNLDIKLSGLSLHSENFSIFKCRNDVALSVYEDPALENQLYVILDALMMVGDEPWIYTGIVTKISEKPNGELDTLTLTFAQRRKYNEQNDWLDIDSYFFHIKYDQVINYNVRYKVRSKETKKVRTLITDVVGSN